MREVRRDWDLALYNSSDWEGLDEGLYTFKSFGSDAEKEAELFAHHLGKVCSGVFFEKLKECLDKR